MQPADTDANPAREPMRGPGTPANPAREVLGALPVLSRVVWFTLGALVATAVTLIAVTRPWTRARQSESALPYEIFPFTDNAGVCQEYVALANAQSTHEAA